MSITGLDRRLNIRLPVKIELICRKVGSENDAIHTGSTLNVSTGGLYFETRSQAFQAGNLLKVDMSIPPTEGLLEFGGKISGFVRVLRIDEMPAVKSDTASGRPVMGSLRSFACHLRFQVSNHVPALFFRPDAFKYFDSRPCHIDAIIFLDQFRLRSPPGGVLWLCVRIGQ